MDEFGPEVLMNKLTDLPDDSDQIEGFYRPKRVSGDRECETF
jgi:hypothetical protein